jgi:hypothetical protein
MIEAKLKEANKLHGFECICLGQKNVERSNKGIIGLLRLERKQRLKHQPRCALSEETKTTQVVNLERRWQQRLSLWTKTNFASSLEASGLERRRRQQHKFVLVVPKLGIVSCGKDDNQSSFELETSKASRITIR